MYLSLKLKLVKVEVSIGGIIMYLNKFTLLDEIHEHEVIYEKEKRNIFNNSYPLGIFTAKHFEHIEFEPITIFCGGNGSGKTTLLNIIAEKLHASRKAPFNKGSIFYHYVELCNVDYTQPQEIKVITSDDVFDFLLNVRSINAHVNRQKEELSSAYLNAKYRDTQDAYKTYEQLKDTCDARSSTMSKYIRTHLGNNNIIEHSNGESALAFWEREIKENALYLLDEPENSLSAENQLKLKQFIEDSARFYHCQFILSTHSPFLLHLNHAKIYDLDENPVCTKSWNEVKNVQTYYRFFKEKEKEFNE